MKHFPYRICSIMCQVRGFCGFILFLVTTALASHQDALMDKNLNQELTTHIHSAITTTTIKEASETSSKLTNSTGSYLDSKDLISASGNSKQGFDLPNVTILRDEAMTSSAYPPVDEANGVESFGVTQYMCFIVKQRNLINATYETIACSVPKNSKMSELGYITYCKISVKRYKVIAMSPGHCNAISPDVMKQFGHTERGHMLAVTNGTVSSVRIICLSPKKFIGSLADTYVCVLVDSSIKLQDTVRLFDYLMKKCNYPATVIKRANIRIVDTVHQCSKLQPSAERFDTYTDKLASDAKSTIIITMTFGSFGIIFNLAGIVILLKGGIEQTQRCRTPLYFVIMLVMDTLDLLGSHVVMLVWMETLPPLPSGACHLTIAINLAGTMVTTFCLLAITVERYLAVCHPLKVSIVLSRSVQNKVRVIHAYYVKIYINILFFSL